MFIPFLRMNSKKGQTKKPVLIPKLINKNVRKQKPKTEQIRERLLGIYEAGKTINTI